MPATTAANEPTTNKPILDELVAEALRQSPHFSRRNVRIETQAGDVVLRGTVSSYYHKQMAQEVLRRIDGVRRIENRLEVDWR
ncbi:MAG TPA: BON domain-containing protein [Pirellulales bacterium]|nr:BON domain-containing protein [Pirellulales bacterium]